MTENTHKSTPDVLRSLAQLYGFDPDNLTNADREKIAHKALQSSLLSNSSHQKLAHAVKDLIINEKFQTPFISLQPQLDTDNKKINNVDEDFIINPILLKSFASLSSDNDNTKTVPNQVKNIETLISDIRKKSSVDNVDNNQPKKN